MIVFNYEILEDFLSALNRRVSNEIFSQYIEPEQNSELVAYRHKLILQFIGRPDPSNIHFAVLHQIAIPISGSKEREEIIGNLKKAFQTSGEVHLIQGYINEIIIAGNEYKFLTGHLDLENPFFPDYSYIRE